MTERERFEAWFKDHYVKHGFISSKDEAWMIWQAALSGDSKPEWISVKDRLPDFNEKVIVLVEGTKEHSGLVWERMGTAFCVRHDSDEFVNNSKWSTNWLRDAAKTIDADYADVTYWMPLPAPTIASAPQEGKG